MRAHDRRAIAEDLFEVAGEGDVRVEHVEELIRRYRERLAGAQRILLTSQVGDEILAWQAAPRPSSPRAGDARREDDEVIGIALDGISSAGVEMLPAPSTVAAPASPSLELDLPPAPVPAAPPIPAPTPSAPERPRTGAALWAAPQRGTTGSRGAVGSGGQGVGPAAVASAAAETEAEQGLWAPLREPTPRGAAPSPLALDAVAPQPPALDAIDLGGRDEPPRPDASPPPAAPAALGHLDVAGLSSRPPPRPAPLPLDAAALAAAPPGAAAPPSGARVGGAPEPMKLAAIAGGGALAILLLAVLALRPSCLFAPPTTEVQGRITSTHLGIAITFPEPWLHAASRDADREQGEWERASSVFFQGVDVDEFAIQLTVVTLQHEDRPATDDDLRSVGAAELAGGAQRRKCAPYDRYGGKAVRCTGLETRGDRRFAMLEEYFVTGPRIVYARGLVETASAPLDADAPPPPESRRTGAERPASDAIGSPLAEVDARRLEAVLDSIEPLEP